MAVSIAGAITAPHHQRVRCWLAGMLAVAALNAVAAPAAATTVYAAASLRDAFPRIAPATYSFAGSGTLQRQIERGAPADVFASASPKEAQALYRGGHCTKPVTFATNRLALLVAHRNPTHVRSISSLKQGRRRIAIGTAGVPVGAYTRVVLARLKLTSILSRNIVSDEPNVSSITAKVALGSADAGFAYITDAHAARGRVRAISLPARAQPSVRYELCIVKRHRADTKGARRFIAAVRGKRGRAVLKAAGFGLPAR